MAYRKIKLLPATKPFGNEAGGGAWGLCTYVAETVLARPAYYGKLGDLDQVKAIGELMEAAKSLEGTGYLYLTEAQHEWLLPKLEPMQSDVFGRGVPQKIQRHLALLFREVHVAEQLSDEQAEREIAAQRAAHAAPADPAQPSSN